MIEDHELESRRHLADEYSARELAEAELAATAEKRKKMEACQILNDVICAGRMAREGKGARRLFDIQVERLEKALGERGDLFALGLFKVLALKVAAWVDGGDFPIIEDFLAITSEIWRAKES